MPFYGMARDEVDEYCNNQVLDSFKMVRNVAEAVVDKTTTIHSGHFMVSCLNDEEPDEDINIESVKNVPTGYDFASASKQTKKSYLFNPKKAAEAAGIESDLSKLFQCMTLAYRYDFIVILNTDVVQ